ncbi:hypothetical protein CH274_09110 [Rhodococcus sp. 06-418-5]|nr:hypothetical protein CH276_15840 [Rhodococcus sp. 06-470-2]OZC83076.1 hypothetical protein CH274_09110 [Rhodococcus sp. 06-418-5]OZE05777.1 hypothetical protein CH249_21570 [Rhodococcus sp. 05-2255-3B1]OZE08984.1 hypothetical protein CH250_14845 [Rhodococcus sp. 05-2255-3C]OZE17931.1 hypothetical protein CH255_14840 [Rhodococcus sp. 05-2255-2A2]OZE64164.1 hypothetical protein CH265_10480 [Rhodococcus sp. 05-2221-1B]OZF26438.1 hypothetical protein CH296_22070 [Rhodococcus sp. 14-2496-1d]
MTDSLALVCERCTDADSVERVVRLAGRGVRVVQDNGFESHHTLIRRTRGLFHPVEPGSLPVSIRSVMRDELIQSHITTERV